MCFAFQDAVDEEKRQTRGTAGKRKAEEEDIGLRVRERAQTVVVALAARVPERHVDPHAVNCGSGHIAAEHSWDVLAVQHNTAAASVVVQAVRVWVKGDGRRGRGLVLIDPDEGRLANTAVANEEDLERLHGDIRACRLGFEIKKGERENEGEVIHQRKKGENT